MTDMFETEDDRGNLRRLELYYLPKHDSWLNMAESDLRVLRRQCLDQRLPTMEQVTAVMPSWGRGHNDHRITLQ